MKSCADILLAQLMPKWYIGELDLGLLISRTASAIKTAAFTRFVHAVFRLEFGLWCSWLLILLQLWGAPSSEDPTGLRPWTLQREFYPVTPPPHPAANPLSGLESTKFERKFTRMTDDLACSIRFPVADLEQTVPGITLHTSSLCSYKKRCSLLAVGGVS